jgi:3-deoxy-D-manno-octulosonic-acid transferase
MAKNFGATTLLVNGRISDRSFRRSKWIRWLMKGITRYLDRALMQTPEDASRIEVYGAKDVEVLGNSKFDQAAESNSKSAADWRKELGIGADEFVLIVGSTRSEVEEEVVFSALRTVKTRDLRIIYAPRHLERAEFVAARAKAEGFDLGLRSKGETSKFLLLDTYGELSSLYAIADLAIIGGGFDALGGQNLLQPLAHGVPVLHGPHMDNFREVTKLANERGAALSLSDASAMGETIQRLMDNPEERRRMGEAARILVQEHVGASERYASAIADEAKAFAEKNAAWLAKRASVQSNP